jgi:hypothetical protein
LTRGFSRNIYAAPIYLRAWPGEISPARFLPRWRAGPKRFAIGPGEKRFGGTTTVTGNQSDSIVNFRFSVFVVSSVVPVRKTSFPPVVDSL